MAAAEASYKRLLSLDQRNFDANHLLGVLFYQRSETQTAFSYLDKARKISPTNADCRNHIGLVLQKLGKVRQAQIEFELAIKLRPNSAEAYNNLANLFGKTGQLSKSLKLFRKVCQLAPQNALARINYSAALLAVNDLKRALEECNEAIRISKTLAEAYVQRAIVLHRLGKFIDAKTDCERAISLKPNLAEAYCNLSNTLVSLKRYDEARINSEKSLSLRPHFTEAFVNLASALNGLKRPEEALQSYGKALRLEPNNPVVYHNIGLTLHELKRFDEALASYDKAIQLKPDYVEVYIDRGNALKTLKRFDEALASYDKAISLKPDYAEAYSVRGKTLRKLKRFNEALASYDKAISINGDKASFYGNRGALLIETGNSDAALQDYCQQLRILASRETSAQQIVDDCVRLLSVETIPAIYSSEDELQNTRRRVDKVLDELVSKYETTTSLSDKQVEVSRNMAHRLTGFYLAYHQTNDRETMKKLSFVTSKLLNVRDYACPSRDRRRDRIRFGIASRRLRNHNGANWAYSWLAQLPKSDYEFFTYNFDFVQDELAYKFSQLGTHQELKFSAETQDEVISRMRNDCLDYLMLPDVGMSSLSRVLSLHRIAPHQFTAWGHPLTTGSAQMDYYLSSELMEPANGQDHYSEKLIRLPNLALYLGENDGYELPRKDFGLPDDRILYGCLQSLFKYLPRYDEIWPRVAEQVPNALFVFLEGRPAYMTDILRSRLEDAFLRYGLDSDRHVVFLPRQKPEDYDALLKSMHVSIDSVGWSGGNTSLSAIRYGVPLITLPGTYMRGRHTYAMFKMLGIEEPIASSLEQYIEKLIRLGTRADHRHHCSSILEQNRHKLYEDKLFTRAFDLFLKENVLI